MDLEDKVVLLFEVTDYGKTRGAFSPKAYEIPKTGEQMCHELEKGNMLLKDELIDILSKTSELKQKELIIRLQKATKLGHNYVFNFLKKFAKYYCNIKIAEKNAKIYTLKQNSL